MGLSSLLKRKAGPRAVGEPADEVQQARTRARQRLIGAVVLLGIGIVGFPLVFETQPRPIPVDIPIEIPRKEGMPPLAAPPARPPAPTGSSSTLANPGEARRATPSPDDGMITEPRDEAARDSPAAETGRASDATAARTAPPRLASARPESTKTEPKAAARTDTRADTKAEARPGAGDDGARALALLDGKAPTTAAAAAAADSSSTRFIVQVGAFADASAAQDTRQKIERLGLKTYTQVASTPAGSRIRVRVGPFPSRDEADRALAKARSAGLSAVVLTL